MELHKFNRKILVENKWLNLLEDSYELPNGASCTYYHTQQDDAVMAISIEVNNGQLSTYIVNQYRHPIGRTIWQFPIGGFNPGTQDPVDAARMELFEETGLNVGAISYMGNFYANPGFTNQKVHVCVSSTVVKKSNPRLEELEYGLISKSIPVDEIAGMIATGEMGDAWGITGLHYLNKYVDTLL